jgi:hypothetical protein
MDTSPEAWKVYVDLLRKMPASKKLDRVCEMWAFGRALAIAGMRQRHPNADDREVFLRVARQSLGDELFRKVYGDVLPHDSKPRIPSTH